LSYILTTPRRPHIRNQEEKAERVRIKQEADETEARHRAEFEAMVQKAAEEGKNKPTRVGMSTEFRTPEAVAEMEQVYGYEAVHGCARPPKPEEEEEEEEVEVEVEVRAPSTPDAADAERLSDESEWLLVSEGADGLSAHSEETETLSEGSAAAAPTSPEEKHDEPAGAAVEEEAEEEQVRAVVGGMVGALGGLVLPDAKEQEEFRRELRERSLARAAAKTEARDGALLLDAMAAATQQPQGDSEGGDGGEKVLQADEAQSVRPSSARRPVVWGTAQYKSLWAAAMRLGETQPPETPEEPAEEEPLGDTPAALVEESATQGAAAVGAVEAVEDVVGDVDSDSDDDDGYGTDEDPFERNFAVHAVAGQPAVVPPRRPMSAPAEPMAVEEEEVEEAMSDSDDEDEGDEDAPAAGRTFEMIADVTDVQVEFGAEAAQDSDPDGLDELD